MTLANCIALSNVETKLAVHLTEKKSNAEIEGISKKRKVKTSPTLLEKLRDPESLEFYKLRCLVKPVAKFGQVNDITSLVILVFVLMSAISSKAEGNANDIKKYEIVLAGIMKYIMATGIATAPFILMDAALQDALDHHKCTKEKETVRLEEKQLESKTLQRAVKLIKALQREDQDFNLNFARSLLNNVDISRNTSEYNEKLIILLSRIMEDESLENLEELANHLDKEIKVNTDNASKEFLDNKVVRQLVKSYSPKRS